MVMKHAPPILDVPAHSIVSTDCVRNQS